MAMRTVAPFAWPRAPYAGINSNPTTLTMNADGEQVGFTFQVPKTGTLAGCEFYIINNAFNTPDNGLKVSFQNVDTSGNPDGSDDEYIVLASGALSAGTWTTASPITSDGTSGGTKRSVTKGDQLAIVLAFAGTFVASDSLQIGANNCSDNAIGVIFPESAWACLTRSGAGTWTKQPQLAGTLALLYDDGSSVAIGPFPWWPTITLVQAPSFNSGSATNERGIYWTQPYTARVFGLWIFADLDNGNTISLYDTDGTTVLASGSVTPGQRGTTGVSNGLIVTPDSPVVYAGSAYRLAVKSTDGTGISIREATFQSSTLRQAVTPYANVQYTARKDAGAWSQDATKFVHVGLFFDQIDVTAAGGGETAHVFIG